VKNHRFIGLLDAPAAIDVDHLAGHVVAVVAGEERRRAGDVVGIGHALDLQRFADDVVVGLALALLEADLDKVLVELFPERGHHHAGRVAVDGDVVLGQPTAPQWVSARQPYFEVQ
jgi:hypothetical protein